jgi:hypothetical protein
MKVLIDTVYRAVKELYDRTKPSGVDFVKFTIDFDETGRIAEISYTPPPRGVVRAVARHVLLEVDAGRGKPRPYKRTGRADTYSWRRASIGCTFVAERAGMAQASRAAAASTAVMPASRVGLATPMPSSLPARARSEITLRIAPRTKPITRTRTVDRTTRPNTLPGVAPNAMRMPNSRVRRETE